MPQRDSAPLGAPCWVDLFTSDPDRAEAFYGELFGWRAEHTGEEYGGYVNFSVGDHRVAGCMRNSGESRAPDSWTVYLAVEDAEATTQAARQHGGSVVVAPMQVGELGTMAVVTDAGQASVGLWQPGLHRGIGLLTEPGAPSWFELHARDYGTAVAFYRDVFGWDTHVASDTDDFRYTTLGEGEGQLAGVMDAAGSLPEGVPSHWSVYFGSVDADATVDRAVELGGSVVMGPESTPYGRLAWLADPTGAAFNIVQG